MLHSLRWRLVLSYALLTVLTVSVVGVLALSLVQRYVGRQESQHLRANADAVARQARLLMWPVPRYHDLAELAQTAAFLGNARVRILGSEGQVLADSGPDAESEEFVWVVPPAEWRTAASGEALPPVILAFTSAREWLSSSPLDEDPLLRGLPHSTGLTLVRRLQGVWGVRLVFEGGQGTGQTTPSAAQTVSGQRSARVVAVPIGDAQQPLGQVEVSSGPDFVSQAMATTRQAFLLAGAGATALAVVVGLWVSQGLSAPLRRLAAVAGQMSQGDLAVRAPDFGRDEIGQLARQFNQLAERLQVSFGQLAAERDALRRFVTDASHELRTPITALKSFVDLMQGPAAHDSAAREEVRAESRAQVERLEWITGNLLDLSRLDGGLAALDLAEQDIGELLRSAAATFGPLAVERGVTLRVQAPDPPIGRRCDRARMEMALCNLLDNALKFTAPGGEVEMGAEERDGALCLWVSDTGAGIDPQDLPHIFERFYRGRGSQGSGLGLAIVQSVVQAHGGRVSVESQPGLGSRFVIEFRRDD